MIVELLYLGFFWKEIIGAQNFVQLPASDGLRKF